MVNVSLVTFVPLKILDAALAMIFLTPAVDHVTSGDA
jgi:hypothetical protein